MKFVLSMLILSFILISTACQTQPDQSKGDESVSGWAAYLPKSVSKVEKTPEEWKKELTEEEYYVLRDKGTERAFTGDLLEINTEGLYICRGCGLPLFSSDTKYESGTGWPSYYQPLKKEFIKEDTDYNLSYPRTEVMCAQCGGHLGHVFPDGPKPTGLRYCLNSVSLDFIPVVSKKEKEN